MKSHRRVPRYTAAVVFYGYTNYGLSNQQKWNGVLLELSLLGCGFASNQSLRILDRVVVSLVLSYKDNNNELQSAHFKQFATIRYSISGSVGTAKYTYGCEFDQLDISTVLNLEKIISYVQFNPPELIKSNDSEDLDII